MSWYYIGVLICISVMANSIGYIFMCLPFVSSLVKYLFNSFAHIFFFSFFAHFFFNWVIYFLIELENSLYILDPSLWLEIRSENIFSSLWLVLNFGFVVLGFTFRFIVHFELAFPCGVRIHVFFLAYGYPVVQSVFVEKTILSPLSCPCTFV